MVDQILSILTLSKYTKRSDLLHQLISRGFVLRDRELRSTIEHLITDEHFCIGSCSKGYYLISTEADLDMAMRELRAKAEALSIRANCLIRNWKQQQPETQISLFV